MTTFCIYDVAIGDPVEIVASDTATPRIRQMLQTHGRYYTFDGYEADQGMVFATSGYGRHEAFPADEVIIK